MLRAANFAGKILVQMAQFVFCGDPGDFTREALVSSHFVIVPDLRAAHDAVRIFGQEAMLFVNSNIVRSKQNDLEKVIRECQPTIALVYDDLPNAEMTALMLKHPIDHIIPRASENSRSCIIQVLSQRQRFAPKHFQPGQLVHRQDVTLTNSDQCDDLYRQLGKYVQSLNCFPGFEGVVLTAASELLTNAFYNGKRNLKTGAPLVTDRRVKFALEKGETITLTYGHEQNYFWLMVCDPFGSLDRNTLVRALNRAAVERTPKINNNGGAGLGMLMLFDWSTELNVFLDRNRSTCVACKFRLTNRNRVFEAEPSAIHIFASNAPAPAPAI